MSAVLWAAPKPVSTPQPISAADASGMSLSIFTALIAGTTVDSVNVPLADIWSIGWPLRRKRGVPSSRAPVAMVGKPTSHRCPCPP
jgi:hypothetical protein